MKFAILNPKARTFTYVEAPDFAPVVRQAGLLSGEIDLGVLKPLRHGGGIGYAVYQFSNYVPPDRQSYCSIEGTGALIAGNAVLFEYARGGATIDLSEDWKLEPIWFSGPEAVEAAIVAARVIRPELAINGEVIWAWPQPAPPDLAEMVRP